MNKTKKKKSFVGKKSLNKLWTSDCIGSKIHRFTTWDILFYSVYY